MKRINMMLPELPYAVEEALNRLRINIKFCGKNTRKILITSSIPNEGKSFVAVQLWKMLAEAGFPTVMVDLDLRKSVLKTRHDMSYENELQGLDYYLSGLAEYEDVVYETNVKNGFIIPCSNVLENPSALFEDPRFEGLLNQLSKDYRYVIIDSPPLVDVADGALIASVCDGAVLIVRSGHTSKKLVKQSVQQLERVGCKLLGMVLNRVETNSHTYGKYYGRYGYGKYGEYYGYGKDASDVR